MWHLDLHSLHQRIPGSIHLLHGLNVLDEPAIFCGNQDIRLWESGDEEEIRKEVIRKLSAAGGGGYIFQSDHSVSSNVSGRTYDYIMKLVKQYGQYPLKLDK